MKPNEPKFNDIETQKDLSRFLELIRLRLKLIDENAELAMDADLEGMGLDSNSALNLMLDLEEEFGVFFPESMFTEETFATPNALWNILLALRA